MEEEDSELVEVDELLECSLDGFEVSEEDVISDVEGSSLDGFEEDSDAEFLESELDETSLDGVVDSVLEEYELLVVELPQLASKSADTRRMNLFEFFILIIFPYKLKGAEWIVAITED